MPHQICGFENLHRHSDFSLLDGFATVAEYAERMPSINQKFLCITDHGVMGAVPQQISECEKHNLNPVFGCELYVNYRQQECETRYESAAYRKSLGDGGKVASIEQKRFDKSSHMTAIAYTEEGYQNLVRITSWGWIHGYYRKPRVNHEVLQCYKEGIVFLSGCASSEIANALKQEGEEAALQMLEKYIKMFSPHFYLEIMMIDWKGQIPYNDFLLKAHEKYGVPLVLTQDCFVEDTLVLAKHGLVPIQNISVGDLVWTHENRWRKVEVIGSRSLRDAEHVYRVKTKVGTYSYEATGSHEIQVANKTNESWSFTLKETKDLDTKIDHLVISKFDPKEVFSADPLDRIDLMPFLKDYDFQLGDVYESSPKGNMACRLQFNEKTQEFWSYRGWDRKHKTTIPRFLAVDEDLLKVMGWYLAEGWSEKNSNQVGFALHRDEQDVASWLIEYFSQFGIKAKTYTVSENGIAVRFSSVVFNRFFQRSCGMGSNNKHLPRLDHDTFFGQWSKSQLMQILQCYWLGDGRFLTHGGRSFDSTSKTLIFEVALCFNACGIFSYPSVLDGREDTWHESWCLAFSGNRGRQIEILLECGECEPANHRDAIELEHCWVVPVKEIAVVDYDKLVYDFQVEEDHTFVANLTVSSNCHYCAKEHSHNQRLMLMQQNKRTIQQVNAMIESGEAEDLFELQDTNLWLKSEDELNAKWEAGYQGIIDYELFKQAKSNSVKIAQLAEGVELNREIKLPKVANADELLWQETLRGFRARGCPTTTQYSNRIREEYDLICEKGFASYFLIQKQMTDEARRVGPEILGFGDGSEAVGPGRGSACGSLVAYCLRLHDVEPIIHDLRFSRFLSPARGGRQLRIRHSLQPIPHEEVDWKKEL